MITITIPKKEYQELVEKRLRYEYLRQILEEDIFNSPPTRNIKRILATFGKTKRYNQRFLKALKRGLKRSSYFQA